MKLTSLLPFLVLAACGDSGPSKEESMRIFAAANTALSTGQSRAVSQAQGSPFAAPADLTLDYTGACSLGGTVAITGSYTGTGGTQATFDLATTFAACAEAQGTLDGDVHWTSTANGTSFSAAMTGTLDWDDGSNAASCVLDLHLDVSVAGVSYTGSLCGYDVTQLSI